MGARRNGVVGGPKGGKLRRPATKVNYPSLLNKEKLSSVVVVVSAAATNLSEVISASIPEPVIFTEEVVETKPQLEPELAEKTVSTVSFVSRQTPTITEEIEPTASVISEEAVEIAPEIIFDFPKEESKKDKGKGKGKRGWKKKFTATSEED